MAGLFQGIFQSKAAAAHSIKQPSVPTSASGTQAQADTLTDTSRQAGLASTNLSAVRKLRDASGLKQNLGSA